MTTTLHLRKRKTNLMDFLHGSRKLRRAKGRSFTAAPDSVVVLNGKSPRLTEWKGYWPDIGAISPWTTRRSSRSIQTKATIPRSHSGAIGRALTPNKWCRLLGYSVPIQTSCIQMENYTTNRKRSFRAAYLQRKKSWRRHRPTSQLLLRIRPRESLKRRRRTRP